MMETWKQSLSIARKELSIYFGSPMALIFVGAFLLVTLFAFFWVDTFFARDIADIRPLFRWIPVLTIFLVAALTMRQWSEEQRSGTLEVLLTLPVRRSALVLGKFLAIMALVALALALTLFVPITVRALGPLDWGPVVGGYLAALLMASTYAAIGLFVSSRTDNQIVSLIATVFLGGAFYLVGSSAVTSLVGGTLEEIARAIGTGSRFESIERGVVDLRDLVYYLSLTAFFLLLNVISLDSKGWSKGQQSAPHRRQVFLTVVLVAANLVALNTWLFPATALRADLTADREYSLSPVTKDLLTNLQEPLLIRGYFSEKTHPLLAPLIPTIRDTLREYQLASGGKVELDILDPVTDPAKEAEANQSYGIQPTAFQLAGRYETSIINSYFDVLIRYGDQYQVLNFRDLIEVDTSGDTVEVRFRNLEYDLTSAIKKVVYGFQSVDAVLAALDEPAQLTLYVTRNTLPASLADVPDTIGKVAQDIAGASNGKLIYSVVDPDAADSTVTRQDLYDLYGLQPFAASPFGGDTYYLHMVLKAGDQTQVIYPSVNMTEADVRTSIESTVKRATPGFLQVVGLWTPPPTTTQDMYGQAQSPLATWDELNSSLAQEYEVRSLDLSTGQVPADVDVVVVVAPQGMTDTERYAIDQYLMRGGSVVVAAGNYGITLNEVGTWLTLTPLEDGLRDMLSSYGIDVGKSLVMDPQNEPFPAVVNRTVGGMQVQELQAIDYPFFVDVRANGMATQSPIVSNLSAVTMNWTSPITLDVTKNAGRQTTILLQSSPASWTQTDTNIQPDFDAYPDLGFAVGSERQAYPLAVSVQGVFESAFKGKPSPLVSGEGAEGTTTTEQPTPTATAEQPISTTIEVSPESSRLVVLGSAEFLDDTVFNISSRLAGERYLSSLQLMQNAVAWCTEDLDLLDIRARGTYARVLSPVTQSQESLWEGANYLVALAGVVAIGMVGNMRRRRQRPFELAPLEAADTPVSKGGQR
jgi:ABC-2 type transport system permease protein